VKPWRTGRKVGRTIYEQQYDEPSDGDPLIGVMDTYTLAKAAVEAHNRQPDLTALRVAVAKLTTLVSECGEDRARDDWQREVQAVLDAARTVCQPACDECNGTGTVLEAPANVLDGRAYREVCPACDGRGIRKNR
jgi:hypothetical protein